MKKYWWLGLIVLFTFLGGTIVTFRHLLEVAGYLSYFGSGISDNRIIFGSLFSGVTAAIIMTTIITIGWLAWNAKHWLKMKIKTGS